MRSISEEHNMQRGTVHLIVSGIWGIYAIVTSSLVIVFGYSGVWSWLSLIAAITGNSAHMVVFAAKTQFGQVDVSSQKG